MYARRLAIVLVFFSFASRGECQQVDAKKLCELIRTPKGSMLIGIGFNTQRGFVIAGESTDHSAEIAALEKALCGDAMDAERYYRLSELYDDEDKCKQASAKAADLFWKQLQADPRNGRLAMRLGQSLPVENEAEGERLLRLAVQLAPKDGECWMALGDFLWGKIFDALLTPTTRGMSQMETLMNIVITRSVPKENLQAAYKIANEANACMEKAVTVAPRQPRHYVARALSRSLNIVLDEGSRALADDKRDLVDCMCRIVEQLSQRKVIADIQKAAELEPTNPRAQVFAGAVELLPLFGNELAKLK
ncbi:MAG TPA: hypothetical protein VFE62_21260, partial [Gemmataceae bacterium]|nr:hypothetical protein [Gemmataceae bacterium]